jgi:hypothetical protein
MEQELSEPILDTLTEMRCTLGAPTFELEGKLAPLLHRWLFTLVCWQVGQVWEVERHECSEER